MILPTKRIPHDRSLLGIGGEILNLLVEPKTVSRVWDDFKSNRYNSPHSRIIITYDWFLLALDVLYAINAIRMEKGLLRKTAR
jgi:hypothetical protein